MNPGDPQLATQKVLPENLVLADHSKWITKSWNYDSLIAVLQEMDSMFTKLLLRHGLQTVYQIN
jgi:hypothetical protein